jgi:hypothetical protein
MGRRKVFDSFMFYFWWNIWKEWNGQAFQQVSKQPRDVVYLIKEDIQQYANIIGFSVLPSVLDSRKVLFLH